jgi:YbbR domain-containing protein
MNLRSIVFDNWGIKLVSLVLAATLWFYVTSKGKSEMTLMAPLELRNTPRNLAVVGSVTGYIDVRVQGQERLLRDITVGKKVGGILDLSLAQAGENIIRLSPDDIRRPSGVSVTHIAPAEITVKLEPLMRKTFRLKPVLRGAPALGYRITGMKVIPPKITIEGPGSAVSVFDKLQTMPIDIQGATQNVTVEPRIDYQGQSVKISEQHIDITIFIEKVKK